MARKLLASTDGPRARRSSERHFGLQYRSGPGKDIERGGKKVQDGARDVQRKM